jgi:hypothetical protein
MESGLSFKQKYGFLSLLAATMAMTGLPGSNVTFWSVLFFIWLFLGGHRTIYLTYHTLGRDLRYFEIFLLRLYWDSLRILVRFVIKLSVISNMGANREIL